MGTAGEQDGAGLGPGRGGAGLSILHLTHPGHGAGSTVSISELARAQAEAGHRVVVGCPGWSRLAELCRGAGVEVVPLAFDGASALAARIANLARERGIEVVNAHSSRDRAACRLARLAGRLPGALVMTRRAMPRSLPISLLLNGFLADLTIAVSREVARALVRRGAPPWRLKVVPNGLDPRRVDRPVPAASLEAARQAVRAAPTRPTVGVLARRKDHAVLLAALPLLERPVTLACVGIEADARLARLARAAPPHHRVAFVPFQPDPLPYLFIFDVVALPSRQEGFSQALLEAMALGRPVVASRAGGNLDLVSDGADGLLVSPRRPAAFARALARVLEDRALAARLGEAARRTARERFTLARTVELTEAAYRAALARRAKRW